MLVKDNVFVPSQADRFRQIFAGNAGDGRFASGIDFGEHQNIRLIERAAEIRPRETCVRVVAVRLEENEQAVVAAAAGGFECGANLGGVMAVIVNQRDARDGRP